MAKIKGYPLLNNVALLYFIVIVFVLNLGVFIYIKDNQSIFLIACSAIIVYLFNNNMIIVLLLSMLIVNSLIVINKLIGKKEGLENMSEDFESDEKKKESLENETQENFDETFEENFQEPNASSNATIAEVDSTCKNLTKQINLALNGIESESQKLSETNKDLNLINLNSKINEIKALTN